MVPLLLAIGLAFDLAPQCVTANDVTACGYHCVTSLTGAKCSKTPDGLCGSTGTSRLACFDAAPDVRWLLARKKRIERPSCMSSDSEVACGFHCLQSGSAVRCSQTPMGACAANQGSIACWDPPEPVRWRMLQEHKIERAQCISFLGHIECGYHCTTVGSSLRCAASPAGMCQTHFTQVSCFDPPWDDVLPQPPSEDL